MDSACVVSEALAPGAAAASAARAETISAREWDAALDLFDDISFEQSGMYAGHRWGGENVVCLAVRDANGGLLGGAVCTLFRLPLLGGLAYIRFGPVWRRKGEAPCLSRFETVITALRDHIAARGLALSLMPRPHPRFAALEAEGLLRLGFVRSRDMIDADRYMVDCSLSAEQQTASLAQTWRSNLRKSEKAGLSIIDLDYANYDAFIALYNSMTQRKQVTLYGPVEIVPHLLDSLPASMHPAGLLALHEGKAVAGVIYAQIGDVAYYMFGATGDASLPLRAGYALQWAVLELLRVRARWYDLGGAPEEGLRQFKSGLVGKSGTLVHMPGEFDYMPGLRGSLSVMTVFGLRELRRRLRGALSSLRNT